MEKLDLRKTYIMVLDVETAGGLQNPLVYDLGFAIMDKKGNIQEKYSFIISEIFDNKDLMNTAYYAEKVPSYLIDLENKKSVKVPFLVAREVFIKCMRKYNINTISAYNLRFDMRALKNTIQYLLGENKKFLPLEFADVNLKCIMSFACEVLYSRPSFINFVDKHNLYTPKGNCLTTAEIGYAYLMNNPTFEEEHKGLDDVIIECFIMAKCIAQNKKHKSGILGNSWRIVANYKKSREV